jgi:molecular chaperone IbpA
MTYATLLTAYGPLLNTSNTVTTEKVTGYPPYNIVKTSDMTYVIEMAVAGFKEDEIQVVVKENVLTIKGNNVTEEKEYIHRGIASRSFARTLRLADTIEIKGAYLADGMLTIELENVIPEEKKERLILISSKKSTPELLVENS